MIRIIYLFSLLLSIKMLAAQTFSIGHISTTLNDTARGNRQIDVEIYYPADLAGDNVPVKTGSFPVIALGHGFSMTFDAYSNFWNELVPQGYILILPKTETGPVPFPNHSDFAGDLNFCVNFLLAQNTNSASPFFGKVYRKAAVMGHSMGGGCSFLAASTNPNITTVIGFAPAETNPSAIAAAASVTVPTLIFIGSKDNVTPAAGNATAIYNAVSASCKTHVTITDGSHCRFAESNTLCEFGETSVCIGCSFLGRSEHHALTFEFLNPWLRFYLKSRCDDLTVFEDRLDSTTGIVYERACSDSLPSTQIILRNDTLFATPEGAIYEWYVDNAQIFGSNDDFFVPFADGNYHAVLIDENGCEAASQTIPVVLTSEIAVMQSKLRIYPNPTSGLFTVQGAEGQFTLFDKLGREVLQTEESQFDISNFDAGVYFFRMEFQKNVSYHRIVKH